MDNVADLLTSRLSAESVRAMRAIGAAAESAGAVPFLVGGSVRDALADDQTTIDLDVALVGADDATFARIAELTGGQISRRSQFGTAKLQLDSLEIDLAMARAEDYPRPGSLPFVRPGTLEEDLSRRDFSVNAMAVSLRSQSWGDLVDLHDGLADLKQGRLRVLHENSFRDDPTRLLRAARYASRLDLSPTAGTLETLLQSVSFLDSVSPARLRNELDRVFLERDPSGAMKLLSDWTVLRRIHPCLEFNADPWDGFATEARALPPHARASLGYAILACGISEADVNGLIFRLNPRATERRSIEYSATLGRMSATELVSFSNSSLARVLDPLAESAVLGVGMAMGGKLGCRISQYVRSHRGLRPHLNGDSLIEMGVPRGPTVGRILKRLRNAWLDCEVSTASEEWALAEELAVEVAES